MRFLPHPLVQPPIVRDEFISSAQRVTDIVSTLSRAYWIIRRESRFRSRRTSMTRLETQLQPRWIEDPQERAYRNPNATRASAPPPPLRLSWTIPVLPAIFPLFRPASRFRPRAQARLINSYLISERGTTGQRTPLASRPPLPLFLLSPPPPPCAVSGGDDGGGYREAYSRIRRGHILHIINNNCLWTAFPFALGCQFVGRYWIRSALTTNIISISAWMMKERESSSDVRGAV